MEEVRKIGAYIRDGDFPLALKHVSSQSNMDLHSHDYYELVYVVRGKGIHYLGENRFSIGENNVFLIPPGVAHGYGETESLELYNVLFEKERLINPVFDLEGMAGYQLLFHIDPFLSADCSDSRLIFVDEERIVPLLEELKKSLEETADGWRYISRHLFERILFIIISKYRPLPQNSPMDRLARLMAFIREHLEGELSLGRLCAEGGMSRSSLTRAFQQVYGISPMEKVRRLRVEKASLLLRNGSDSIQNVGEACGFSSSAYFSRVFKEETGLTPRDYRGITPGSEV